MTQEKPDWFPRASAPLIDDKILKKLYPDFLELKQLIVIHRHGDRTPLAPRFQGVLPSNWNFCAKGNQKLAHIPAGGAAPRSSVLLYHKISEVVEARDALKVPFVPNSILEASSCTYGQLTDVGRATLERNGRHLRKIYSEHLNFLPQKLEGAAPDDFYFRTTDYPRTIESLQHLLLGLFPDFLQNKTPIVFRTRTPNQDSLLVDFKCQQIPIFRKMFYAENNSLLKEGWEKLRGDLVKNTALGPILASPEFDKSSSIHFVYDSLNSAHAHGVALPEGVSSKHMKALNLLEVQFWLGAFLKYPELPRVGIGRLYSEIKDQLSLAAAAKEPHPKLAVYSGHDTTLGPFLIGLEGFNNIWPSYGSMVTTFFSNLIAAR
ncbi:hypothetical protein DSO57_1015324 [Entomophthora muscae]|uniref:Uncharacterized protein n=1 Tax=Entomophthora muscae TaxID=34485 RepID=A0ACC2UEZ1_9FUNG|nr:hypothetical protein DSO57_1015324 [Entomophthora muscae]